LRRYANGAIPLVRAGWTTVAAMKRVGDRAEVPLK
jgi:hypothetical protein